MDFYTVHGILQARILEWVPVPFSTGSSHPRGWTQVSHIVSCSLPVEPPGNDIQKLTKILQGNFKGIQMSPIS